MYKQNVRRIALAIAILAAVAPSAALASTHHRKRHHAPRHHHAVQQARVAAPSMSPAELIASNIQDYALTQGCMVINPID